MKRIKIECQVCGHRAESIFCALAGAHLEKLEREKIEGLNIRFIPHFCPQKHLGEFWIDYRTRYI